jgi:membrane protease YdiL (CAAX protease family)
MTEDGGGHPFHQWVETARPREQLWRTVLGAGIVVAVWLAWSMLVLFIAGSTGMINGSIVNGLLYGGVVYISYIDIYSLLGVVMVTFFGLWLGVWAAARWVHKRKPAGVISLTGRISRREFGIGCAIAAAYVAVSAVVTTLMGSAPSWSGADLGAWAIGTLSLLPLIFVQSAGEELFFRGYLTQQLAARFNHPLVWGLVPSVAFGLAHVGNAGGEVQMTIYYVVATGIMGLIFTAMVWRTGGLAAAMGFHTVNNLTGFTIAGYDTGSAPTTLLSWRADEMVGPGPADLLMLGLLLAFVLSPFAPLPKGQPLRRKETRAAP